MKISKKIVAAMVVAAFAVPTMALAFSIPNIPGMATKVEQPQQEQKAPRKAPRMTATKLTKTEAPKPDRPAPLPTVALRTDKVEGGTDWRDANFQINVVDSGGAGIGYALMYAGDYLTMEEKGDAVVITGHCSSYFFDEYGGGPFRIVPGDYDAVFWKMGYHPVIVRIHVPGRVAEPIVLQPGGPTRIDIIE